MLRPKAPLITEIVVECPMCGDKSFMQKIKGQYCLGNLEDGKVIMTDIPTEIDTVSGKLLQKVLVKTTRGE